MAVTSYQPTLFEFAADQARGLMERRAQEGGQRRQQPAPVRALHVHSLEAQDATSGEMKGRKAAILAWLRENGPATDRQVRDALFGDHADMNTVRPRITELVALGKCHEVGAVKDEVTGLHVRIVRAMNEGEV